MKTLLVLFLFCGNSVWISGHPSDPCVGTVCGKGAQCKTVSNLVVCICPEDSVGDPFVECRSLTVTTTPGPDSAPTTTTTPATTVIPVQPSYVPVAAIEPSPSPVELAPEPVKVEVDSVGSQSQHQDHISGQTSNPSPSMTVETKKDSEDQTPYFPSAPPTLSHYAHSHTFHQHLNSGPIQFGPTTDIPSQYHQQLNQLYNTNTRSRPRPQQHAHLPHNNAVNPEPMASGNGGGNYGHIQSQDYPRPYPQHNAEFDLHQRNPPAPLYRTEHRHSPPNNHFANHHGHHNSFHSQPHHPHHYQQNPNFNLKSEAHLSQQHGQKLNHDGAIEKDPLGKYENCRTINNIIVCADTSSDSEPHHRRIHPHPISEHRYPAHSNGHGPPFNNFNSNDNKHNQLPHGFNPPHHSSNFNDKYNPASSASGNSNYYLVPASKTEFGHEERPNHFQPVSRPSPITVEENSYGLRPPATPADMGPPAGPTTLTHPHTGIKQDHQQHFHDSNKNPAEPQPGSSDYALCKKLCGEGSVCRVLMGRPICGCPEGHTGDPSVKCYIEQNTKYDPNACQRHTDCSTAQFCHKSQCTDPCVTKGVDLPNISSFHYSLDTAGANNGSLCGVNAICTVIEHNALCSCEPNHFGNPYVGCVV